MTSKRTLVARCLLGAAFVVFGANGFLHFMPIPPARPAAERFIGAIIDTGYFFQMAKVIEIAAGALLLANRCVPLGLALLAPLLWSITSIHLVLNPAGLPLMVGLLAPYAYLVRAYWPHFRGLVSARAVLLLVVLAAGCRGRAPGASVEATPVPPARLVAGTYALGAQNTWVEFVGANLTETHQGTFTVVAGRAVVGDRAGQPIESLALAIDLTSLRIEPAMLREHLQSRDFLDVARFPEATFESTAIAPEGSLAGWRVTGVVSLHGTRRPISFPGTLDPQAAPGRLSARAELHLRRQDFGIEYPGLQDNLIRDDVVVRVRIDAERTRGS